MRMLSSKLTKQNKFGYPPAVLIGLAISVAVNFNDSAAKYTYHGSVSPLAIFLILAIPLTVFMYFYGMRLKSVALDGTDLVISNFIDTIRVPLHDVEEVKSNLLKMPEIITIRLRTDTRFGRKIVYLPPWRLVSTGWSRSPIVGELQSLVTEARK